MAKTRRTAATALRPGWHLGLLALAIAAGAGLFAYREPLTGNAAAATAYSARVVCSCRYVAGRSLGDCAKDKIAGMELVMLSDDDESQSVTATFPLVTSDTASYRRGYGCVLQRWDG